jgi:translation elongation factor EF-1beta
MVAMAMLIVKVMPEGVETDMDLLKTDCETKITEVYGDVGEIRVKEVPLAFGLKFFEFTFIMTESIGGDIIVEKMNEISGVASAQVIDFRRTLG